MPKQTPEAVHIGLDYSKAINAKREILSSEVTLLKIIKKIRSYSSLRTKEFTTKNKLKKTLIETKRIISDIENSFPSKKEIEMIEEKTTKKEKQLLEKPKKQDPIEKTIKPIKEEAIEKKKNREIEKELQEIQEKLARLG